MKSKPLPHRCGRNGAALLFALVLSTVSVVSAGATAQRDQLASKEAANTREIVLPIEGMSCVACVARVKKELGALPGVAAVNVDLAERHARIRFNPERVSAKQLAAAVEKLGYKAGEPKDAPKQK